jgi:hypothetical protein
MLIYFLCWNKVIADRVSLGDNSERNLPEGNFNFYFDPVEWTTGTSDLRRR